METPNEITWPEAVWKDINDGVLKGSPRCGSSKSVSDYYGSVPTQRND